MRNFTIILAMVLMISIAFECSAQKQNRDGKGKDKNGKKAQKGDRQGRQAMGDPVEMATKMIKEYDQNGDNKLDNAELAVMLSTRGRRGAGQAQGRRGEGRKGKRGGQATGKRKQADENNSEAGKQGKKGRKGKGKKGKNAQSEDAGGVVPSRPNKDG